MTDNEQTWILIQLAQVETQARTEGAADEEAAAAKLTADVEQHKRMNQNARDVALADAEYLCAFDLEVFPCAYLKEVGRAFDDDVPGFPRALRA